MKDHPLITLTTIPLFSALIIFGSYIKLPMLGIPITAQSFFIMLVALLWGVKIAVASVALWIFLGILGLPVFATGANGLAFFIMPTSGYILGYLLMAIVAGWVGHIKFPVTLSSTIRIILRTILLIPALLSVYLIGLPWLRWRSGHQLADGSMEWLSWQEIFWMGFLLFLLPDLIKSILVAITYELLPRPHQQEQ